MTETNEVTHSKLAASGLALVLAAFASAAAHAERWTQASPTDSRVWYDVDSVRPTSDHLVSVWVATGPHRTNREPSGGLSYPTYSIIDCRQRTAGSKMSLDSGKGLEPYAANTGMGELIEKVCP
jgi:hypothetical protein